jgi:acetylornithine deacetylase/succinyl-diaminopimelate desuccinylase-like protein
LTAKQERIGLSILLALTAAFAIAVHYYDQHLAKEASTGTFVPHLEKITPEIKLLQEYVRVNTSNPPGNEVSGARWLGARLAREHVAYEIIESAPGRGNLYARIRGRRHDGALLLLNHIDVMPADPRTWTQKPFAADIVINMMWGRGTLDMKGIAICQLEAFLAVARSGRTPEHDLVFLATADEERGSSAGMAWLLAHRPDIFEGIRYALNEGGITETTREELSYFGIEVGSKQVVTIRVRADSREELRKARVALEPWTFRDEPDRVLPAVARYFHDLAPIRVEPRPLLTDINATVRNGRFWRLDKNYRELLQNTVFADGAHPDAGGFLMNVFLVNLPDEVPEQRIDWLRSVLKPYRVEIEVARADGPAPTTSPDSPFFRLLVREARNEYGPVPAGTIVLNASFNDSRFLRQRGVDCFGVWPFPVDLFQTLGIHHGDERIRLDWFMQGVSLTKRIVNAYSFQTNALQ